jgi:hypothetical protein
MSTAPKDTAILISWGTNSSGHLGYDVGISYRDGLWKSEISHDTINSGGYCAIAWMPLPEPPNDRTELPPGNGGRSQPKDTNGK